MPMVYAVVPGVIQTTNATPLTANDCAFFKPGATRNVGLQALYVTGRGAARTAIRGGRPFRQRERNTADRGEGRSAPCDVQGLEPHVAGGPGLEEGAIVWGQVRCVCEVGSVV